MFDPDKDPVKSHVHADDLKQEWVKELGEQIIQSIQTNVPMAQHPKTFK